MRALALAGCLVATSAGLAACSGASGPSITLYNGQHPQLTTAMVSAFERRTGIHVSVRTDDGIVLADEILQEGRRSPADVYFTENSPELMLLGEHGLLARLPATITGQIPSRFDSPSGNWVGVALRVSCLAYDPSLVSRAMLPKSVMDLSGRQWKGRIAIAPTDSDFVPLVGAVMATYGRQAALDWLRGLKENASLYQDDESVMAAVNRGQAAVGIINQYYFYRLRLEVGAARMHARIYFFPGGDVGSVENISGAAVLASSPNKAEAERFVAFLVSPEGQRIIASGDDYEYPARPGVAPNPVLEPIASVDPAVVNVVRLGDDRAAAALLQEAGLA